MRLNCVVERRDRQLAVLALSGRRPGVSVLTIGQKFNGGDVSIVHQSITTKENTCYKVKGNIQKVFTKFINEGKITLSFMSPPHDLMIKADDIIQLKSFLSSLRMVLQGKQLSKGSGGLSSLDSSVKVQRPKSKLVVSSKVDYPTLQGFPRTLLELHIIGIERTTFDSRILKLQQLRVLDLSDNCLKILPPGLGDLPYLSELYLAKNELGATAHQRGAWNWLRGSHLSTSLHKLDLSHNKIPALPSFIRDCSGIFTLKLDFNQLTVLPSGMGNMKSLRFLTAANNNLKFLPGSLLKKQLEHLDVSHNPFSGDCITANMLNMNPLTLKELAARAVIDYKFFVSEAVIPWTVLNFMQRCDFCICGRACFNPPYSKILQYDTRKIATNTIVGATESVMKPFRVCYCSERCVKSKFFKLWAP